MDPLAHTLVGASLAETGLKRATPLATATLVLGANIPDIDVVTTALGVDAQLYFRRGHTHGVVAMVVLPLALTALMMGYDRLWRRRRDPEAEPARAGPLLGLALLSTLTHPALDWMNSYGVRLLMPFDGTWFYGDALFIIDPWMWLLMAAAVVLGRSGSKPSVAAWIVLASATSALLFVTDDVSWLARAVWFASVAVIVGLRLRGHSEARTRHVAMASVTMLLVYLGGMLAGTALARGQADAWLRARGHAPTAVMAGPLPANPFVREVIAATPNGYRFLLVDWFATETVRETAPPVIGDARDEVVEAALASPTMRGMSNWSRFPSYEVEQLQDGYRVTIRDMRYVDSSAPIGEAVVELDRSLQPRE